MKKLKKTEILKRYRKLIKTPVYSEKPVIEGVVLVEVKNISTEKGTFEELMRFNRKGESKILKGFKIFQLSRSKLLPGAIKAWHLHFNQEDIWYVPSEAYILVGLFDLRKNSKTANFKMRFVMGGGQSQLLLIPRGVAHGVANLSEKESEIIYFTNQYFNPSDEIRLPWDLLGNGFWQMQLE